MKKILVIGGTGAFGTYLVPELLSMGYAVDAITLEEAESNHPNLRYITARGTDELLQSLFAENRYAGIVDFIHYQPAEYANRHRLLLENTDHLLFLSSYRIYADLEHPIRETSPQLIDTATDPLFLETDTYGLSKSRCERILLDSPYDNWTAVRPLISSSKRRFDLITTGAPVLIERSRQGKPILLPESTRHKVAGLGWAGNVARMMARLVTSDNTFREAYTLGTGEVHTWDEVAGWYHDLLGSEFIWVNNEDFLKYGMPDSLGHRWMLEYDRMYDRTIDAGKMMAATGFTLSDFVPVHDAIARELAELPTDMHWAENADLTARMDGYIAGLK